MHEYYHQCIVLLWINRSYIVINSIPRFTISQIIDVRFFINTASFGIPRFECWKVPSIRHKHTKRNWLRTWLEQLCWVGFLTMHCVVQYFTLHLLFSFQKTLLRSIDFVFVVWRVCTWGWWSIGWLFQRAHVPSNQSKSEEFGRMSIFYGQRIMRIWMINFKIMFDVLLIIEELNKIQTLSISNQIKQTKMF